MYAAPAASESIRPRAIVCSGREKSLGLRPISSRRGRSTRTMASMWVTVVSFTTRASQDGMRRGPVEDVSLERFAGGHGIRIRRESRRFCRREVVERARSRLGERRYRVLTNNCEHFCAWAVRGEVRSGQVERFRFALTALLRLNNSRLIRQAFGRLLSRGEPQPILWCNRVTPALVMGSARNDRSDRRPRQQCRRRNWGAAHARAILDPYRSRHVVAIGVFDTCDSIGAGGCRAASKSNRRNHRHRAEAGTVGQHGRHVDHRRDRRRAAEERGIKSVAELTRLVPGLTIQESSFNSTSFTLRGVGFFNSDLATPPAVTVYVDEAPLPYPAMTKLAAFDLARVEVLKGPQGTLYGQNARAAPCNYIAAKPPTTLERASILATDALTAFKLGGFVSGPITDQRRRANCRSRPKRRRVAGKHHASGRRAGQDPRAAEPAPCSNGALARGSHRASRSLTRTTAPTVSRPNSSRRWPRFRPWPLRACWRSPS